MSSIRNIYNRKLLDIVFPQCRENACFEHIIVRDYVADILKWTIHSWLCLQQEDKFSEPFSTSLISPGGDCKRKLEAAWMRSVASMMEWLPSATVMELLVQFGDLGNSRKANYNLYIYGTCIYFNFDNLSKLSSELRLGHTSSHRSRRRYTTSHRLYKAVSIISTAPLQTTFDINSSCKQHLKLTFWCVRASQPNSLSRRCTIST